jgi:4'-phosphopantetheinyl transferase
VTAPERFPARGASGSHRGSEVATWWLARAEPQLPPVGEWLTPAERGWAEGLRYTKRRTDFLLGRWTFKLAVARVSGWPEDSVTLARIEGRSAPDGAPELYVDGRPDPRGVSLSDRAGCAVCLVAARPVAVGCDLELVEPRSDAFVRDYLTGPERRWVAGAGAARDEAANLVWSAKESALKVLRTGLRRDTRSVEVTVPGPMPPERIWSPFRVRTAEAGVFAGWWRRTGAFLLTACWAGSGPAPAALEEVSPLETESPSHRWLDRPVS